MSVDLLQFRRLLIEQEHDALPMPFLVVLIVLLSIHTEPYLSPVGTAQSHRDCGNIRLRPVPVRCGTTLLRE